MVCMIVVSTACLLPVAVSHLFLCAIFLAVHREFSDIGERATEKAR